MGAKIKESVMTPFKGSSITKAKGDLGGGEFQQQTIISRTDCDIASWEKNISFRCRCWNFQTLFQKCNLLSDNLRKKRILEHLSYVFSLAHKSVMGAHIRTVFFFEAMENETLFFLFSMPPSVTPANSSFSSRCKEETDGVRDFFFFFLSSFKEI